ncbi:MAG: tetratricopeptide repeat protein, partial [Pyrinomonadaceae bacterium]
SALNHPNIITVYEVGEEGDTHFIATEFVDGLTLRQFMRRRQMRMKETLEVATQVAAALITAHNAGIIHRDIKPENIMLRPDGYVKVLDFGIAKLTERLIETKASASIDSKLSGLPINVEGESSVEAKREIVEAATIFRGNTGEGEIMGTAEYVSPEQAQGLEVDERTDIWSFGVVLYEMATGRAPFTGRSPREILVSILNDEPVFIRKISPEAPEEYEQIVSRALAKNLDERYQTVKAMSQEIRRFRHELEFKAQLEQSAQSDAATQASLPIIGDEQKDTGWRMKATLLDGTARLRAVTSTAHNLPVHPTPIIGREEEISSIVRLMRDREVRLLTLTGPGGTGKTRLSLETASHLLETFADGVYFVALAPVNAPPLVLSAITQTLGIKESGSTPLVETLKEYLQSKRMLLVLDNFEQVIPAAPLVAELMSAGPRLKFLVTSRAALHLRGEHEFPVQPLALPESQDLPPLDALTQYAAVALFVERAQAVKPDFELTDENARAVVEICERVDGLPLAIELAAARIKLLSPQMMLARLQHPLKLLTGGAQDLPARQQTMRQTIAWSFDLLNEQERRLFMRLSVFTNGSTFEAIEDVCGATINPESDVLDDLASLIDKSLLLRKEQAGEEARFTMLETIREYGAEQLLAQGETDALRRIHALYFMTLAESAEPELTGPQQVTWFKRIEREHDNLRAALRWAKESGEIETGLRIAGALWRFWEVRGHMSEGRRWLEDLLQDSGKASKDVRAKALSRAGAMERDQGDYTQSIMLFEQALALYRELEDRWGIAATLNGIGYTVHEQGDFPRATSIYEESLALFQELGDKRAAAYLLNNLGNVAKEQADYEQAAWIHEQALPLFRELGDKRALAASLNNLGEIAQHRGDYERAAIFHQESLELKREVGDTRGTAISLDNLGDLARYRGDYAQAARLYHESLTLHHKSGDKRGIAHCFEALAEAACAQGDTQRATRLFGAANFLREKIGAPLPLADRPDYERHVAAALAALGQKNFDGQWEQGSTMPLDDALVYALRDAGDSGSVE